MYHFETPIGAVHGVGPKLKAQLQAADIVTVADLLLQLPLRYDDRSQFVLIAAAPKNEVITIQAKVLSNRQYYRNRRPITNVKVSDVSGDLNLIWFNSNFIHRSLQVGQEYLFSGKINDRGMMVQPAFERVGGEGIHTNRLVPLYTSTLLLKQGSLRRIFKQILDRLEVPSDPLSSALSVEYPIKNLKEAIEQLHYPDQEDRVIAARERLALEEIVTLIRRSHQLKEQWNLQSNATKINTDQSELPSTIPFELTAAQLRSIQEILSDLTQDTPMNRILIGDVGSGKTVVAGVAAWQTIRQGYSVALAAPTKVLAAQHATTLHSLFPDTPIELITSQTKKKLSDRASFFVGTHAVLNRLEAIEPALLIYDEQHRFGVKQRSLARALKKQPHLLNMTATPIPRTMLLTIFSHLSVSTIDELPKNRIPTKTWVLPEKKRQPMFDWLAEQVTEAGPGNFQTLVVCPFIDPSDETALENIASTKEKFEKVRQAFKGKAKVGLLHGKLKRTEQEEIIRQLYNKELDILVTTPIVEVGIDLPQASAIVIESAERFGLASLHQLRGRVGRAGQQGYCLLFTSSGRTPSRLTQFSNITDGQKIAELDLKNRGAGDLFGTVQHGFDELRFGSWTNFELIHTAQKLEQQLPADWKSPLATFSLEVEGVLAN